MLSNSIMTDKYNKVLISSIFKHDSRKMIYSENEYMHILPIMNKTQDLCEIVGLNDNDKFNDYQVKPYFDIDA